MLRLEPIDIARLEEQRLALAMAEIANETETVGDGTMSYEAPGSWANVLCGLGLRGAVDPADVDRAVAWYTERNEPTNVELPAPADHSLVEALRMRGFGIRHFENIYAVDTAADSDARAVAALPADVYLDTLDTGDDEQVRAFADLTTSAFEPRLKPDGSGRPMNDAELAIMTKVVRHPNVVSIAAYAKTSSTGSTTTSSGYRPRNGCAERMIGTAGIEIRSIERGPGDRPAMTACLFGMVTRPDWRGRGLQTAMIHRRLATAHARGVCVVTIGSKPGIPTERNARRCGFELAYTKAVMRRPLTV